MQAILPRRATRRGFLAARVVGAVFGAALLAGCGAAGGAQDGKADEARRGPDAPKPPREAATVRVGPVEIGPIPDLYGTSTTLRARREATVTARTRGRVRSLRVEEGDRVAADQVVAQLEDDEQRIALERAQTEQAQLEREHERLRQLYEERLVSENEYEKARRDAESARHATELAALELARTTIRAPFPGVVIERHLDVGATVADGTAVYELADLDPLEADVSVPERHVARLRAGQEVRLVADAIGRDVTARILRIAPSVDAETGTVKVTLAVAASQGLRPGAFVRVEIVSDTRQDAMIVPRRALVAEGSRFRLFRVIEKDGTLVADELEVRTGYEQADRVEIREVAGGKELRAGDRVVVLGAPALTEGAPVRIAEDVARQDDESVEVSDGPAAAGGK